MTIPSSGIISISDLQHTYGGTASPIQISSYYAGAGLVPNPAPISAAQIGGPIPTSGLISLGMFAGTAPSFIFNDVLASNRAGGYNLRSAAIAAGWNQLVPLIATVTVNGGVTLAGGFDSDSGFPAGSTVYLINNGVIIGQGGRGGDGYFGGVGQAGGVGLIASTPMSVRNNGWIAGGGGGGGGGVASDYWKSSPAEYSSGGGGGGGAGLGVGGSGYADPAIVGAYFTYETLYSAPNGSTGDWTSKGYGGSGTGNSRASSGGGGGGGTIASFGWPGGQASGSDNYEDPHGGGAPGAAISGGANITWRYNVGVLGGAVDSYGSTDLGSFTGGNPLSISDGYKGVIFSYPRNNPVSDTVWWPVWNDGQGIVTYPFAGIYCNTSIYPVSVRLYGSIDDTVTAIKVNGAVVYSGATLGLNSASYSPAFNLAPGINLIEIFCANQYSNSPAWMCIDLRAVSSGQVLIPTWAWRQP